MTILSCPPSTCSRDLTEAVSSPVRAEFNPCDWLTHQLEKCQGLTADPDDALLLGMYHYATSIRLQSRFLPARHASEAWVVPDNPLILLSTMSNHDISIITHTVSHAEAYMTKGNGGEGSISKIASELEHRGGSKDLASLIGVKGPQVP